MLIYNILYIQNQANYIIAGFQKVLDENSPYNIGLDDNFLFVVADRMKNNW